MKKHVALLALLGLSSFACQSEFTDPLGLLKTGIDKSEGNGGIGVGNETEVYKDAKYGFALRYAKALSLTKIDDETLEISNGELIHQESGTLIASTLGLRVTPKVNAIAVGIEDSASLLAFIQKASPEATYKPLSLPGADGFFEETTQSDQIFGRYALLTLAGDVIQVELDARTAGQGLSLVAPIVRTLAYDITPPALTEVKVDFDQAVLKPLRVRFRATDAGSGIHVATATFMPLPDSLGHGLNYGRDSISLPDQEVVPIGNDWYQIEVKVPRFARDSDYVLRDLIVSDLADNTETIRLDKLDSATYANTTLPAVKIHVTNLLGQDLAAPVILNVKVPPVITAGAPTKILIQATDDLSQLNRFSISFVNRFDWSDVLWRPELSYGASGFPVPVGDDWYEINFQSSPYIPGGSFVVSSIGAWDNADWVTFILLKHDPQDQLIPTHYEGTQIPLQEFELQNSGTSDTTPPAVLSLKNLTPILKAGETGHLLLEASDDGSGLENIEYGFRRVVDGQFMTGGFGPMSSIVTTSSQKHDLTFVAPQFLPPGDYLLSQWWIFDKAGNSSVDYADTFETKDTILSDYKHTHLPLVWLTVL